MNPQQYGWVVAAFQAAYTIMQPVAGYVLDILGARLGFALFAIGWSLSNCLHAFATGWPSLAMFRGLLGLTEAAAIPAGLKGWARLQGALAAILWPELAIVALAAALVALTLGPPNQLGTWPFLGLWALRQRAQRNL